MRKHTEMSPRSRAVLGLLLLVALCGCRGATTRPDALTVAGKVLLDGQPIPYARIAFAPDFSTEFTVHANVVNGQFTVSAQDGMSPGTYDVCILPYEPEAEELVAAATEGRPSPLKARKLVPMEYQKRGMLKADVSPESASTLLFEMKSGKSK